MAPTPFNDSTRRLDNPSSSPEILFCGGPTICRYFDRVRFGIPMRGFFDIRKLRPNGSICTSLRGRPSNNIVSDRTKW
jgi:hypothetical protein